MWVGAQTCQPFAQNFSEVACTMDDSHLSKPLSHRHLGSLTLTTGKPKTVQTVGTVVIGIYASCKCHLTGWQTAENFLVKLEQRIIPFQHPCLTDSLCHLRTVHLARPCWQLWHRFWGTLVKQVLLVHHLHTQVTHNTCKKKDHYIIALDVADFGDKVLINSSSLHTLCIYTDTF